MEVLACTNNKKITSTSLIICSLCESNLRLSNLGMSKGAKVGLSAKWPRCCPRMEADLSFGTPFSSVPTITFPPCNASKFVSVNSPIICLTSPFGPAYMKNVRFHIVSRYARTNMKLTHYLNWTSRLVWQAG